MENSDFKKAVNIVNYLYNNINIGKSKHKINYSTEECVDFVIDNEVPISCQGFHILCLYLFKKNKIDCRPVVIFGEDSILLDAALWQKYTEWKKEPPAPALQSTIKPKSINGFNHALVEFKYNNKWLLIDPTFNCLYKHNNKFISADEYQICSNKNEKIDFHYEFKIPEKQRIEYYPLPIKLHNKIYYPTCKINKIQKINGSNFNWESCYNDSLYKQFF